MRQMMVLTLMVIVLAAATGCETLQKLTEPLTRPDANVRAVRLTDLRLDRADLDFDVEVKNPYDVPLPVLNMEYGLATQGSSFLSGGADIQDLIPAKGSRTFTMPATVHFSELLDAVASIRPGSVVPYAADVAVSVDAPAIGEIRLPLRKTGELPVPAPPAVSVENVRWGSFSLSEATGVITLAIDNPNAFAATLSTLDYRFALGGAELASARVSQPAALTPGGRATIEIPLSFSPGAFGSSILNIVQGGSAAYRMSGDLAFDTPFGRLQAPFQREGTTPLTR